jgi:hypothetical protein
MPSSDQASIGWAADRHHLQSGLRRFKRGFDQLGLNTAFVERTNLISRQMNGRMVWKTLSFSKEAEMLEASCTWEDWVYNLTRPVKSLRVEVNDGQLRWQPRSAAMAEGLADHVWTIEELLMAVAVPEADNTK